MGSETVCDAKTKLVKIQFSHFVFIGVSLPFISLILCTVTSIYTAFDEVTESVCGVSNFIPSISAVTGITPQLYFWRYAIGLHSAPRILLAVTYYQFHCQCFQFVPSPLLFNVLSRIAFVLNLVDVATFVGVAYVSNRENFPVHQLMFVVFLFASSLYMLVTLILHRILKDGNLLSVRQKYSLGLKLRFFWITMFLIVILIYYFYGHRFRCSPNAFSWFSATEYGIAVSNMAFHLTAAYDFQDLVLTTMVQKTATD